MSIILILKNSLGNSLRKSADTEFSVSRSKKTWLKTLLVRQRNVYRFHLLTAQLPKDILDKASLKNFYTFGARNKVNKASIISTTTYHFDF